jgi:hypothetical protein
MMMLLLLLLLRLVVMMLLLLRIRVRVLLLLTMVGMMLGRKRADARHRTGQRCAAHWRPRKHRNWERWRTTLLLLPEPESLLHLARLFLFFC